MLRAFPAGGPVDFEDRVVRFFEELGLDAMDGWVSFVTSWGIVRCPAGADAWDRAVEAARARPLAIWPDPGRRLAVLASVAGYLDAANPGEPFVFSLPRIMKSFGMAVATASRAVLSLQKLRIIEVVDGDWSYTEGKARTFRLIGNVLDRE